MMQRAKTIDTFLYTASLLILLGVLSCTPSPEQERLNHYLEAIAAEEAAVLPAPGGAASNAPGVTTIVSGTPRQVSAGTCGDGVINGTNEDCDKGAITNPNCNELGGISGIVKCSENCLYDLSDCITPAVNERIGGTAENCKCSCGGNRCGGGCSPTSVNSVGQSQCRFNCDNDCICKCEGKLEAHIERCDFRCICTLDASGNPLCECSMETCDVLAVISPNIANLAGGSGSTGGGH